MRKPCAAVRSSHSSRSVFELGVQGDVAVVVELADGDPQPERGADLDDGVDGEVERVRLDECRCGQELDDRRDERVGSVASSAQELGGGGVVEERGSGLSRWGSRRRR